MTFVLLGVDGALFFGGEEQPEQVVQKSVSQQDEVGRQETAKIIISTWRHETVFTRKQSNESSIQFEQAIN